MFKYFSVQKEQCVDFYFGFIQNPFSSLWTNELQANQSSEQTYFPKCWTIPLK